MFADGTVKGKREIYECARAVSAAIKRKGRNCAPIPAITQTVKGERRKGELGVMA